MRHTITLLALLLTCIPAFGQWNLATREYVDALSLTNHVDVAAGDTILNGEGLFYNSGTGKFELSIPSGAGDVVGPGSSTDNAIPRFDGTGGKTLQGSGVTIDDNGRISIASELLFPEISAPAGDPAANTVWLYAKDNGGTSGLYIETDDGTVFLIGSGGGGGGSGTLTTINGNGSQVGGADIVTLDFSSDFGVAETPDTEINITIGAGITRDTEWDTFAEINAATTDTDAVLDTDIGVTVQAYDADLAAIAALLNTDGNFVVGNGSAWVAETGATARTSLGLGSVENTALSTWAGSANITTLGTIATGTWQGTAIADAYIPNNITIDLATTATTANAGDSATAFFSAGTIEHERGGLEADVSAYGGLVGISGGATLDVNTEAELETALGGLDVTTATELGAWAGSANVTTLGTISTGTWSATDVAVAAGGTGASTAEDARTNLGLVIGTDVQAYNANALLRRIQLEVTRAKLGTSLFPTLDRTQTVFDRLTFDGSTDWSCSWQFFIPADYNDSVVPTVTIVWTSAGTANNVTWDVSVVAVTDGTEAAQSASYATVNSSTVAVPGTSGHTKTTTVTLTNRDSIAAGDLVGINLNRDSSADSNNDNAHVLSVVFNYSI